MGKMTSTVLMKMSMRKFEILRDRSSHQRCSIKKDVLRNFPKFTGKHLCQVLLFNKVAGLRPATLLKKRLWRRCFPVNILKFLRTLFIYFIPETLEMASDHTLLDNPIQFVFM